MILWGKQGFSIKQVNNCFLEVYLSWKDLPCINIEKEYFIVEARPEGNLPSLWGKPTDSKTPIHFTLQENLPYKLYLWVFPFFTYKVTSPLPALPHVDLTQQTQQYYNLVWNNLPESTKTTQYTIYLDNELATTLKQYDLPSFSYAKQIKTIALYDKEDLLFKVETNVHKGYVVCSIPFETQYNAPILYFSEKTSSINKKTLRATIPPSYNLDKQYQKALQEKFPKQDGSTVIGEWYFYENNKLLQKQRGFGYKTTPPLQAFAIVCKEQAINTKANQQITLTLEVTSAHRELFKKQVLSKTIENFAQQEIVGFSLQDIAKAKEKIIHIDSTVIWEECFIELVFYIETEKQAYEFYREIAFANKWEYIPQDAYTNYHCEWRLRDLQVKENEVGYLTSLPYYANPFPPSITLKPYNAQSALVYWEITRPYVESMLQQQWNVTIDQVGFYVKVHEEYCGQRTRRQDLDFHLIDLLNDSQNAYIPLEEGKTFSAELVARHFQEELALTPVSSLLVMPKDIHSPQPPLTSQVNKLEDHWFHPSQKQVLHKHHQDNKNKAKVLLHFHMHTPNMVRLQPFRSPYIQNKPWPIQDANQAEVFNPPGEWIMKNCLDSWIPLLQTFRRLAFKGIDFQISIDISPPVVYTLISKRFQDFFSRYLERTLLFAKSRLALLKATGDSKQAIDAAQWYIQTIYDKTCFYKDEIKKDIIGAFKELEASGHIEISTCTATHGMSGCLQNKPLAIQQQIEVAYYYHQQAFNAPPQGIWLAENSFFPGIESYLSDIGLHYFFAENEAILFGNPSPQSGEQNPVILPSSQIVAFGRSKIGRYQVWDADKGYAGHSSFCEYHHRHWGLPLKRITSKTSEDKEFYNPEEAKQVAFSLAQDFYQKLGQTSHDISQFQLPNTPLLTCSYDAELFGHHWLEGPFFIEELIREIYRTDATIGLTTPSHYLANNPTLPQSMPNPSTWGDNSLHVRWTAPPVAWIQREIDRAMHILDHYKKLIENQSIDSSFRPYLEQMAREILRAQSSDLSFVIQSGSFVEDMQREICKFLDYFYQLKTFIDSRTYQADFLSFREYENPLFPDMKLFE